MAVVPESASGASRIRPAPRWVAPVFAVLGAATIPWTVYLAMSLPDQARNHHYRVAWVGFDILLIVVLLGTAYAAWRGRRIVGLLAASTATMLVADAWFDVTTSRRSEVPRAIVLALLVELPLAIVCGWIALHVDQVVERRIRYLVRRADRLRAESQAAAAGAKVHATPATVAGSQPGRPVAPASVESADRAIDDTGDQR
jgi:hypothetical protein